MVTLARLEWAISSALAGHCVRIISGFADSSCRHKVRVSVGSQADSVPIQLRHGSVQQLQAVKDLVSNPLLRPVDRGHRHSSGHSEFAIWFSSPTSTSASPVVLHQQGYSQDDPQPFIPINPLPPAALSSSSAADCHEQGAKPRKQGPSQSVLPDGLPRTLDGEAGKHKLHAHAPRVRFAQDIQQVLPIFPELPPSALRTLAAEAVQEKRQEVADCMKPLIARAHAELPPAAALQIQRECERKIDESLAQAEADMLRAYGLDTPPLKTRRLEFFSDG